MFSSKTRCIEKQKYRRGSRSSNKLKTPPQHTALLNRNPPRPPKRDKNHESDKILGGKVRVFAWALFGFYGCKLPKICTGVKLPNLHLQNTFFTDSISRVFVLLHGQKLKILNG